MLFGVTFELENALVFVSPVRMPRRLLSDAHPIRRRGLRHEAGTRHNAPRAPDDFCHSWNSR